MSEVEKLQRDFEAELSDWLKSLPAESLFEPVRYIIGSGGKRFRPMLTLMACEMFGENWHAAKNAALAIEVFHNFTLMHDDIMDHAPLRRGKPTVHEKWNTDVAILSGDAMLVEAYKLISKNDSVQLSKILEVFSQTATDVCRGQQFDMDYEKREAVSVADYLEMIRLKTSVLLGSALQIGAIAGRAGNSDQNHLYQFGEQMGMAFQLHDDLLDAFGDASLVGKKKGGDIAAGKKTFLLIRAFEKAKDAERQTLMDASSKSNASGHEAIDRVIKLYIDLGVKEETEEMMERFYDEGMKHLDLIPVPDERKSALRALAQSIMNRVH